MFAIDKADVFAVLGAGIIISGIFNISSTTTARKISEKIPIYILGPIFNILRISWKKISKPTKRKGLSETKFVIRDDELELLSKF